MRQVIFVCLFLALLLTACFDEFSQKLEKVDSLNWNPTIAVPLVKGDFTMGEFVKELSRKNLHIDSNSDGVVKLVYRQPQILSQKASELILLNDVRFTDRITIGQDFPAALPNQTINVSQDYNFDISTSDVDQLHTVYLKGGTLALTLSGDVPAGGSIFITFNSLSKDGEVVSLRYDWSGTNTQAYSEQVNLEGTILDLTNGGTGVNIFDFTTDISINYEGNAIQATNGFSIDMQLNNLQYSRLEGNFVKRDIAPDEQYFRLNFIDEIKRGIFSVDEPQMNFLFYNSFGIPLNVNFSKVRAESKSHGFIDLTGAAVESTLNLAYPLQPGQVEMTPLLINHENSNLPDILAFQPDSIVYAVTGQINPLADTNAHFVTDSSELQVDVVLEVPLIGWINNVSIREPYKFDGSFLEDLNQTIFKITGENGLPIDTKIQAYFLDENNEVLDSLIHDDNNLFKAAEVDLDGFAVGETMTDKDIVMGEDRLIKIIPAQKIVLRVLLNTQEAPLSSIKIHEDDRLKIKLLGQGSFEMEF